MYLQSKYDIAISYDCQKTNNCFRGEILQAINELISQGEKLTKKNIVNKTFEIQRRKGENNAISDTL